MDSESPSSSLADVPSSWVTGFSILTEQFKSQKGEVNSVGPEFSARFSTQYAVMIFVRDAICRVSVSHLPNKTSPFFLSRITHWLALTYGAGFSSSSFCVTIWMSALVGRSGSLISSCRFVRAFVQLAYLL